MDILSKENMKPFSSLDKQMGQDVTGHRYITRPLALAFEECTAHCNASCYPKHGAIAPCPKEINTCNIQAEDVRNSLGKSVICFRGLFAHDMSVSCFIHEEIGGEEWGLLRNDMALSVIFFTFFNIITLNTDQTYELLNIQLSTV